MTPKLRQQGFSLIEALIALVVLSIGLLGAAALQINALQGAAAGYQSTLASIAGLDAQQRVWKLRAYAGSCDDIDLAAEESDWKTQWFADEAQNPLRNVANADTSMTALGDCRFRVKVELPARGDTSPDPLTYNFEILNDWEAEAAGEEE